MTLRLNVGEVLRWTDWFPLVRAGRNPLIPAVSGLYRIRRVGFDGIDYIGQTGNSLRQRLGMLSGVYGDAMPYSDPHTAGPGLWALRHASGCDFEVSVCSTPDRPTQWRKGLECLAIAIYRQERGSSPTVNFGSMPVGYIKSSGNSARLVAEGKRVRGGVTEVDLPSHSPSLRPVGSIEGDPHAGDWCGHHWSEFEPATATSRLPVRSALGMYRLRITTAPELLYIGEGRITARVAAHLATARRVDSRHGSLMAGAAVACSWVVNDGWLPNQRLELETDLIGAHMLTVGRPPAAQFLG